MTDAFFHLTAPSAVEPICCVPLLQSFSARSIEAFRSADQDSHVVTTRPVRLAVTMTTATLAVSESLENTPDVINPPRIPDCHKTVHHVKNRVDGLNLALNMRARPRIYARI